MGREGAADRREPVGGSTLPEACARNTIFRRPTSARTKWSRAPPSNVRSGPSADAGRAEVGAHLHPWSTPPFDAAWDGAGAALPYPHELPRTLLADKLETLTSAVRARSGRAPTSYRAGRWGFSETHVPILTSLGYEVDCSVTPGVSWRHDIGLRAGGPDFLAAGVAPYELAPQDVCRRGDSGLLEVPVTILHTSRPMRACAGLRGSYARHRRSLPWRAADRLFQVAPQWLRPFPHMTAERLNRRLRARPPPSPAGAGDDVPFVGAAAGRVALQSDPRGGRRPLRPPDPGVRAPGVDRRPGARR